MTAFDNLAILQWDLGDKFKYVIEYVLNLWMNFKHFEWISFDDFLFDIKEIFLIFF